MKPRDRLAELKNISDSNVVYHDTVELYIKEPDDHRYYEIEQVFKESERIRAWISEVDACTVLIKSLHSDPTYHTNRYLEEQLNAAVSRAHAAGLKASGALMQLAHMAGHDNSVRARIVRLQHATARHSLGLSLQHHHAALTAVQNTQLSLLQKQIKFANLTVTEEECERLLETNNIQMFVDNIKAETQDARRALRDVENRHAELLKIETSIRDVRDLFVQMGHLVSEQQELIDTVSHYVLHTTEHVQGGGTELLKGNISKTKARKKKVGLIVCLVCGFLILLVVLILT